MTTRRKTEANRQNALKSTGPRTADGKARSSMNALKHGVLFAPPVLPGVEKRETWDAHLAGVVESLAPQGYLEERLAERAALILWRLGRVARYETETTATALETAEKDLLEKHRFETLPPRPIAAAQADMEDHRTLLAFLERLPSLPDDARLPAQDAAEAVALAWNVVEDQVQGEVNVPGVPLEDEDFFAFDGWTAGLVRACFAAYEKASKREAGKLLSALRRDQASKLRATTEEVRTARLELDRFRRKRLLPKPETLDSLSRYETTLERSLLRTLSELERLRASRSGVVLPPPVAVDVQVTDERGSGS